MFVTFDGEKHEVSARTPKADIQGYLYEDLVYPSAPIDTVEVGVIETYMGTVSVRAADKTGSKRWLFLLICFLAFASGILIYTITYNTSETPEVSEVSTNVSSLGAYTNDAEYTPSITSPPPAYTYEGEFDEAMEGMMVDNVPNDVTNPFESEEVLR